MGGGMGGCIVQVSNNLNHGIESFFMFNNSCSLARAFLIAIDNQPSYPLGGGGTCSGCQARSGQLQPLRYFSPARERLIISKTTPTAWILLGGEVGSGGNGSEGEGVA